MTRSELLSVFNIGVLFIALIGCADKSQQSTQPNIIYIMADDLGYGDVGAFGQKIIRTPNIDAIATEGVKFTQHYAGTTVCAPSRCVLMTGMHTGHAEVRGNKQWEPSGQMPISNETVTIAELLKQEKYTTGMIGKWGLGEPGTSGDPLKQGWDFFYGYTDQVLAHNYYPEFLWKNGEKVYLDNEVKYLDPEAWHEGLGSYSTKKVAYSPDLMTEEALGFIEANKNKPFFLYLPFTLPHDNGEAPDSLKNEVPSHGRFAEKDWPYMWKGYAAMIERLDDYVGQVTQKIKQLGLDENTMIIFTSDNGPFKGRAFTTDSVFASNGPLRGFKRDLYEGGIRVPFMARWSGVIPPGTISDHPSGFQDFLATVADITNIQNVPETDGISYFNAMIGEPQEKHEYLYWEFHGTSNTEGPAVRNSQAIIKGDYKAIRNGIFDDPNASIELYNLRYDLGENTNIASDEPTIVAEMITLMDRAHVPDPKWPLFNTEK